MRVILMVGKGGVGKTTLACATALMAAEHGLRTLVVSTDDAHSLEDVLALDVGPEPVAVAPGLEGLQLDARHELERSWGAIVQYLRRLLGASDLDVLRADELVVIPGLDQLVALSRLNALADSDRWDAIVVDCAPSADSLRLLAIPDVMRWYFDRAFGRARSFGRLARRRLERTLALPVPGDEVLESVGALGDELSGLRAMLDRPTTSARLVVTPERVVIAEAQRLLTYLALYDIKVDALLVNRVVDFGADIEELRPWLSEQREQLGVIDSAFSMLPRLAVRRRLTEPVGLTHLLEIGRELYREVAPCCLPSADPHLEISTAPALVLRLLLTGLPRDRVALERRGEELVVTYGAHRRPLRLPDGLRDREVVRAGVNGNYLEVVFGDRSNGC